MTPRAPVRLAEAARALDRLATAFEREDVRSHREIMRELADRAAVPPESDYEAEQRLTDLHAQIMAMADHKEGLDDVFFGRHDWGEQRRLNLELDEMREAVKKLTEPTGRPRLRKRG